MALAAGIAAFAAADRSLPEDMAAAVRLSLLDWASVGLAGVDEPVARAARAVAMQDGSAQAGLLGGGMATVRSAALANGATSHALDYDDTHFLHIGHPSVAVLPAALAVAQSRGSSGADLVTAAGLGLEVSCRIGDWLGRAHYEAGFHQTGTAGAFGAAVAAGRLLGLDAPRMAEALALTATRAAGLKSQFGTMGKPLNAGFAAEVGVTCALLAAEGVRSAESALEGAQGFGPTHAGQARTAAFDDLGKAWVFPQVSYKFHACCHGLHASLEALQGLIDGPVAPQDVAAVRIVTHPRWLAVCNQPAPTTGLGAKFSYRLTAAMVLRGVDTAALSTYDDAITSRPDLVALRDKVVVETDDRLTDMQARVAIETASGTREAFHDLAARSDAATLRARLMAKSATLLGHERAEALSAAVDGIGGADGPKRLFGQLFAG